MKTRSINSGANSFVTSYNYLSGINGATTTKVGSIDNNGKSIAYTYDANGNIATITENNKVITCSYNELNELRREDNQVLDKTIVYTYDGGGNIQSKVEYPYTDPLITPSGATNTVNYTYGDANWKDKLTNFNGKDITYDAIGNPLTYDGYTYSWEWGRRLASMTGNGKTIGYKYNDSGIRTQKTVNNITTNYHLVGDKVTYEDNGTDKIYYTYDSSDNLVSMNLNGVEYYYIRNPQSDIIGLFDGTGTQVVSYVYDSWGKLISIDGSLKDSVGIKNPYRYRGYRYDNETALYYLNSRYYNPEFCRMLNADDTDVLDNTLEDLTDKNLFAYCDNNPVNRSDEYGYFWETILDIGSIGWSAYDLITKPSWGNAGYLAWDVAAAVIPFVPGSYVGKGAKSVSKAVCFTEETPILTKNGYKPIKEIEIGDEVYSENPDTGEKGLKKVKNVFVNETDKLIHLFVENEEIKTTEEHPLWVVGKGWVGAEGLKVGDKLQLYSGKIVELKDLNIELLDNPIKVYNFEVEDWHTYFVSGISVLVHNTCSAAPKYISSHSGRKGAFNEAKRQLGIPRSSQPIKVTKAIDKRGKVIPGRDYYFKGGKVIRNHSNGHSFPDGSKIPRHFNGDKGGKKWHYMY